MKIAVVGGTGMLGRQVVHLLRLRGHEVRVLSRNAQEYRVDLKTGEGLTSALEGCDVVIDASNASSQAEEILVQGSRRLLAAEEAAGVGHHICVSIVGCERVPNGYFRIKAEQERIVEAGRVPWTIVRATQFHEFIAAILAQAGRWRVLPMPRVPLQTVSAEEVARAVADAAEAPPRHGRIEIAGPEIIDTLELADLALDHRQAHALSSLPLPGKLGRALRAGAATEKRPHILGTTRFAVWLKDKGKTMPDEHFDGKERSDTGLDTALLLSFEAERPRLLRVAYAIVGSVAEAEDCVQEAWLRLQRMKDPVAIRDLTAWLTTTVGRLALDALECPRQAEHYVGTWLPEPLVEDTGTSDPAERVALDESVSMALMIVLERLSAAERTAFLLHDVFGLSFDEVASVVGRTPAAVRQLASRARKHVEQGRPRFAPTRAEQRELVHAFATACQEGDLEKLVSLLDPEVVWRGDGGGKVSTVPETRQGAETVARGLLAFTRGALQGVRMAVVNGAPGLVLRDDGGVLTVVSFTVDNRRIVAIDVIRNPDKLTAVRLSD